GPSARGVGGARTDLVFEGQPTRWSRGRPPAPLRVVEHELPAGPQDRIELTLQPDGDRDDDDVVPVALRAHERLETIISDGRALCHPKVLAYALIRVAPRRGETRPTPARGHVVVSGCL